MFLAESSIRFLSRQKLRQGSLAGCRRKHVLNGFPTTGHDLIQSKSVLKTPRTPQSCFTRTGAFILAN